MKCIRKHTDYQPTDAEWRCPKCNSLDHWLIESDNIDFNGFECDLLHATEMISCEKCGCRMSGRKFAEYCIQRKNIMPCPHCNGTGWVTKS